MPVHRLDLAYDGTGFKGYARNDGVRTVQGEIESALRLVLGFDVETAVAGRTDAGVHARSQVVSFETAQPFDVDDVERSLRSMLAPEIAVERLAAADDGFHARFSAGERQYRYFIDEAPVADPLRRHVVWHVGVVLDAEAMNRAAMAFVGEHDFASLCRARRDRTGSALRTITSAHWERRDGLLVYEVRGVAFCHQLVRSMVALCVDVGRGRVGPDDIPGILEAKDRNAARGAAPAHGLVLWEVSY